jgi:predicted class III extradiol MEMO1 family dioxygenase
MPVNSGTLIRSFLRKILTAAAITIQSSHQIFRATHSLEIKREMIAAYVKTVKIISACMIYVFRDGNGTPKQVSS